MRHPTRYLRDYVDAEITPRRREAVRAHLSRCASCRAALAEERRLRSRLRALRVPPAVPGPETGTNGGPAVPEAARPASRQPGRDRRSHALAAGAAVTAAGAVLLAGAYAAGAVLENPPTAGTRAGMAAGWQEVAGSGAGDLTRSQLDSLRLHGWTCPEFAGLGLDLESAHSLQVEGHPAVEMVFTGEGERIRLVEQHPLPGDGRQPVVNAFTGRAVAADGFTARGSDQGPAVFGSDAHPGQMVVAAGSVTYTFESSLPVKSLPRAVEDLSLLESARLARPGAEPDPVERIVRGLSVFARTGWSF